MEGRDSYVCPKCRVFSMVKGAAKHRPSCPLYVAPIEPAKKADSKEDAAKDALERKCLAETGIDLKKSKSLKNMQKDYEKAKASQVKFKEPTEVKTDS